MAARERNNHINLFLSDNELRLLDKRCEENHENRSQVLRELIVYGFNYYVDYDNLTDVVKELNSIGKNINQIAVRANATDSIYKADVEDLRKALDEIWRPLRSMLSKQPSKKR
jgi:hypothetical protein